MDARTPPPPPIDGGGGPIRDAMPMPNPDAFFAMDPPPRYCGPDGGTAMPPPIPGGTPECPDDKHREGCACSPVGSTAPCWPGLRADRGRGQCRDGTTTCMPFDEFQGAWGPCAGAVLPTEGAVRGAPACNCFSTGQWRIDNLSPCFIDYGPGGYYAVSTVGAACPMVPDMPPPPIPATPWSANRLTVDCEGQFELCYTIKAGNVMAPTAADCTVARVCTEAYYATAGMMQELPMLPAWASADSACARAFVTSGGYGEMSVMGLSIECDPIDDMGMPYVFNRVPYCPATCSMHPTSPDCVACSAGGSGTF